MKENITFYPTLKEMEMDLFRTLQQTFSSVFSQMLSDYDDTLAKTRDKGRYRYQEKRSTNMDTMFGPLEIKRTYYYDRVNKEYVYLLDRHLAFEGAKGLSPVVEEMAMEIAVTGPSYRHAASTVGKLLGYNVMSHEAIRQHLLEVEVVPSEPVQPIRRVLFVEVDGLFVKRQTEKVRGREEKIAVVHEGWHVNGKRARLVRKRHYIHKGKDSFWEGFEQCLMDTYGYDPRVHLLVINGDGANWITSCREHFKNAFYCLDRFHVARDIQRIFRDHKRYREIRKALAKYDVDQLILELNSAVGTLEDPKKEEYLEKLIAQLSQYPEALGDYRKWLEEHGIETKGMRAMGSAESTMRVFAKRLKNGRSWSDKGLGAMIHFMAGLKDGLAIKTRMGFMSCAEKKTDPERQPKFYKEKLVSTAGEAVRQNIAYLGQSSGKPVYQALKAMQGL